MLPINKVKREIQKKEPSLPIILRSSPVWPLIVLNKSDRMNPIIDKRLTKDKFISMHSRAELEHAYSRSVSEAISHLKKALIQDVIQIQKPMMVPILLRNLRVNQS